MVSLTVLVLLLLGAGYCTKRERSAKFQEMQKQDDLHQAKKEDCQTKEEALKAIGEAGQVQGWRGWQLVLRGTS